MSLPLSLSEVVGGEGGGTARLGGGVGRGVGRGRCGGGGVCVLPFTQLEISLLQLGQG